MKIQHVPLEWVVQTWPLVESFISSALEHSRDYTSEQVKTYVTMGHWMLLVAVEGGPKDIRGAAVVNIFNRPDARIAMIMAIGGRLITNPDTFEQLKQLMRQFGATALEGAASEPVARLWSRYGFEEKYRIVGAKL